MTTDHKADIFVYHDLHPEDGAMLQALYSRSPESVVNHLDKVKDSGSGKFMDKYYVGYGHASIGDCGQTTLFIEQVSQLVAKAIQDSPLYNGQEASTRYLDFSKQALHDPYDHPASRDVIQGWMDLYNWSLPKLIDALKVKFPYDPDQKKSEKIWENAIKARAFDTARSLLPVATTTLLSWSTNLRHARDHLMRLGNHPLQEVRDVAQTIFAKITEQYPHSFNGEELSETNERYAERNAYAKKFAAKNHYLNADDAIKNFGISDDEIAKLQNGEMIVRRNAIDIEQIQACEMDTIQCRPKGAALPWRLEAYGRYNCFALLDFGSFRDIQRHRNGVCQSPLIDSRFGMHPWYMGQFQNLLSAPDFQELNMRIKTLLETAESLSGQGIKTNKIDDQYLYPMGMSLLMHTSYSLPQMVYVGEIRSSKTVHPSLRPIAQTLLNILEEDFPGITLYGDMDEEAWTVKRGDQTISKKAEAVAG